jgi:hypothetical protein
MVTQKQLDELIDHIQGSCIGLDAGCEDLGFSEAELTLEQRYYIDSKILECSTCGWWFEYGDWSERDDSVCSSCGEDE